MRFLLRLAGLGLGLALVASGHGSVHAEECLPPHAAILIYHHVADETPASTSVTPETFDAHLDFLAEGGFHVADLETVVQALRTGADLPDSTVVLTFDDGYESVYETAFPRLRERGWPFTVFVCPDIIDRGVGPVMTWDQLREMAAAGALVANHGWNHDFMNRPQAQESTEQHQQRLEKEWLQAQDRLEEELGAAPEILAYTYGEYSPAVQAVVEKLGWTALGQQSGAVGPRSDFTCLPRFPMATDFASLDTFGQKVSSLPWPAGLTQRTDPMLPVDQPEAPVLTLVADMACLRAGSVAAYASQQGAIPVQWLDEDAGFLQIQAPNPLPRGRSRYNVTAPSPLPGRWYWFSQVWIVGQEHSS